MHLNAKAERQIHAGKECFEMNMSSQELCSSLSKLPVDLFLW